jgi:hypothetical protein
MYGLYIINNIVHIYNIFMGDVYNLKVTRFEPMLYMGVCFIQIYLFDSRILTLNLAFEFVLNSKMRNFFFNFFSRSGYCFFFFLFF